MAAPITSSFDAFNPAVPEEKPASYVGLSKPISDVKFVSAEGEKLKDIGNIVSGAIKATDYVIDKSAELDAKTRAEQERNMFTAALEDIPGSGAEGGALPPGTEGAFAQATALNAARGAKKGPETYFTGRGAVIQKETRSQWGSGYWDTIDKEFSKVYGGNPANEYYKNMLKNLRAGQVNAQAEQHHIMREVLRRSGLEGMPTVYEKAKAGDLKQAIDWIQETDAKILVRDNRIKQLQEDEKQYGIDVRKRTETMNTEQAEIVNDKMNAVIDAASSGPKSLTFNQLSTIMSDWRAGKGNKLDATTLDSYGRMAEGILADTLERIRKKNIENGHTQVLGAKAVDDAAIVAVAPIQRLVDGFRAKDLGAAFQEARDNKHMTEGAKNGIFTHGELGSRYRVIDAMKDIVGPQNVMDFIQINDPKLKLKMRGDVQIFTENLKAKLSIPGANNFDGTPINSVSAAIDHIGAAQRRTDPNNAHFPGTYQEVFGLLDGPEGLANTNNPAIRQSLAEKFFGPENWGVLRKIVPDQYIKTPDGKTVFQRGQENYFSRATSIPVLQAVNATGDLRIKQDAVDWVEITVARDLFRDELQKLNSSGLGTNASAWKIEWSRIDTKFVVKPNDPRAIDLARKYTGRNEAIPGISNSIDRLNLGIQGLANTYKVFSRGDDTTVDSKVLTFIAEQDPQRGPVSSALIEALVAAHKKKVPE